MYIYCTTKINLDSTNYKLMANLSPKNSIFIAFIKNVSMLDKFN